jgi:hypothetical protein
MKKLLLVLFVSAVAAIAQGRGQHGPAHSQQPPAPQQRFTPPQSNWQRFGQPGFQRPMPVRPPIVVQRPIVINRPTYIRPYVRFGMYDWSFYYRWGYWPYYPWSYGPENVIVYQTPQPCKKEKLKDSEGKKHEVLVCMQPDGTTKVVADANNLVPAK